MGDRNGRMVLVTGYWLHPGRIFQISKYMEDHRKSKLLIVGERNYKYGKKYIGNLEVSNFNCSLEYEFMVFSIQIY